MKQINEKTIRRKLEDVLDPELGISIVDLGLVYKIAVDKKGGILLTMTLTTIGCPLFSTIEDEVRNKLGELGIKKAMVKIKLTFDPPWTMEMMSERAKALIGI